MTEISGGISTRPPAPAPDAGPRPGRRPHAPWAPVYQLKSSRFTRVEAVDPETAFAALTGCDPANCTGGALLLRTTNGGQGWEEITPQLPEFPLKSNLEPGRAFTWLRFQFLSADVGHAAGDIRENALLRGMPLMVTRDGACQFHILCFKALCSGFGQFADRIPNRSLPGRDRNDPNSYEWAGWLAGRGGPSGFTLGVPGSYRTTASVAAPDAYVNWGDSGVSWAIPYVDGLLTLGLQVDPDATFADLWRALEQTAARNARGVPMLNPAAYIAAVRR